MLHVTGSDRRPNSLTDYGDGNSLVPDSWVGGPSGVEGPTCDRGHVSRDVRGKGRESGSTS